MSLLNGWHQCRFDPAHFAASGMVRQALIYARTSNKITQNATWDADRHVYDVEDYETGQPYTAATLKDVMAIAQQREQLRQASTPTRRRNKT